MICKFSVTVPTKTGRGKELSASCRFNTISEIEGSAEVLAKMMQQVVSQAQEEQCVLEVKEIMDK